MQTKSTFRITGVQVALTIALGLTLIFGSGSALAQDPEPTVRPSAIDAFNTQLIGQVDTGAPIDGTLTVDGQPFVLADGSVRRIGPNGLEPGVSLDPVTSFIGLEQEGIVGKWNIIDAWPGRGGTTFFMKYDGVDGESLVDPLPAVVLADGSVNILIGGFGRDNVAGQPGRGPAIAHLKPDGSMSLLPLADLGAPTSDGYYTILLEKGQPGTAYIKYDGIDGEAVHTGWFDHVGNFNVVGAIEFQDGDDYFLFKGNPATGVWTEMRPLGLVINLSVGWEPRTAIPIVPHGDGGMTIIATELDAGRKAFSYDAAGNLMAENDLPAQRVDASTPKLQEFMLTDSYPVFIAPGSRAEDSWQMINLDPAQTDPINLTDLPADFVPRPDLFVEMGQDGQAYLAVADRSGAVALMSINLYSGHGNILGDVTYHPAMIGSVGPDNNLYSTSGAGTEFMQITPGGKVTPFKVDGLSPTVSSFSFGVERELYVIDRSGTVSIYQP